MQRLGFEARTPVAFQGHSALLRRITALYDTIAYRRQRRADEAQWIYGSPYFEVWISDEDGSGEDFAYLVIRNGMVAEWGGDATTVLGMTRALCEQQGSSLCFRFPSETAIPEAFQRAMSGWSIEPFAQIQVLDTSAVLAAFSGTPGLPSTAELSVLDAAAQTSVLFGGLKNAPLNLFLPSTDSV
jgi:hypothetical protein